jgi:hypothetical protein
LKGRQPRKKELKNRHQELIAYLDRDISDARAFWSLVVLPDVKDFKSASTDVRLGLHVGWSLWHLHNWVWHDKYPGVETRGDLYRQFQDKLIADCPGLGLLRDFADAAKHCGLGRDVQVQQITQTPGRYGAGGLDMYGGYDVGGIALASSQPERAIIEKGNGTIHWLESVVDDVFDFWKSHHFLTEGVRDNKLEFGHDAPRHPPPERSSPTS